MADGVQAWVEGDRMKVAQQEAEMNLMEVAAQSSVSYEILILKD